MSMRSKVCVHAAPRPALTHLGGKPLSVLSVAVAEETDAATVAVVLLLGEVNVLGSGWGGRRGDGWGPGRTIG